MYIDLYQKNALFDIWELYFWKIEQCVFSSWNLEMLEFVILNTHQGLVCCFSKRGDKVSMGHFKEIEFGLINIFVLYRVEKCPTNVFSHIGWWHNYWSLLVPPPSQSPSPSPASAKVSCQGAKKMKRTYFDDSHDFHKKGQKSVR